MVSAFAFAGVFDQEEQAGESWRSEGDVDGEEEGAMNAAGCYAQQVEPYDEDDAQAAKDTVKS